MQVMYLSVLQWTLLSLFLNAIYSIALFLFHFYGGLLMRSTQTFVLRDWADDVLA